MTVCPIGNRIFKCGGMIESNEYLHRIDLYCPIRNMWTSIQPDKQFVSGIGAGNAQISKNSIIIFGGYNPLTRQNQAIDYII